MVRGGGQGVMVMVRGDGPGVMVRSGGQWVMGKQVLT